MRKWTTKMQPKKTEVAEHADDIGTRRKGRSGKLGRVALSLVGLTNASALPPVRMVVYKMKFCKVPVMTASWERKRQTSSGASGGCPHWGASFKVEKAHFAAREKGLENHKNEVKLPPPCVPPPESEDFSLLVTFLLVTFSWLFRGFSWLFRGPHLLGKTVFGRFSWLFRGPHFGQILRVLAWKSLLTEALYEDEENHINKIIAGLSQDYGEGGGNLLYVFFSPIRNDQQSKHINIILPPTQSRTIPQICSCSCVLLFFLSMSNPCHSWMSLGGQDRVTKIATPGPSECLAHRRRGSWGPLLWALGP